MSRKSPSISEQIREAAKSHAEASSVRKLAKAANVPYASLHGFLQGSQLASSTLDRLARHLGIGV